MPIMLCLSGFQWKLLHNDARILLDQATIPRTKEYLAIHER